VRFFYFDASAMVKRFVVEAGSPLIHQLFTAVPVTRMMSLLLAVGETFSVLVRRRNSGALSASAFSLAFAELRTEVIDRSDWRFEPVEASSARASLLFIEQYSLNATDAIVLQSALGVAVTLRSRGDDLVLVASDSRLVSAARAEGLLTFNPETEGLAELNALISS
jgi:predicted nucleic acid-binding protein